MKKITIDFVRALLCLKFSYLKRKIPGTLFGALTLLTCNLATAQYVSLLHLTGAVYTADNVPLSGATVRSSFDGRLSITDKDGRFQLDIKDTTGFLMVSYVGYHTTKVAYRKDFNVLFKITLIADANNLKEVIVSTGYQNLPKERATGSFVQVDNQLIERRVSSDLLSRLDGVVPGLIFNRNTVNGQSGQSDISIRGVSTLFANNQPLIVVDGFPYDGDLNNLNPNDVESITILKDAAAASIWGVRSGNGVIVVTTKKGKRNQPLNIELNANITIGSKPDLYYNPNFLPSGTFIDLEKELFSAGAYNDDLSTGYKAVSPVVQLLADQQAGTISAANATAQINAFRNIDVRRDLSRYFYQHAASQQYALGISGGTEKSDYLISLGEDHDVAAQVGNLNNRITVNSGFDFNPVKDLTIRIGYNFIKSDTQNNSSVASIITTSKNTIYPYAQLANADGNGLAIVHDYAQKYINTASKGKFLDWNYNPLQELAVADNTSETMDNRLNLGLNYKLFKYFSVDLKYQYERAYSNADNNYGPGTYYARNLINTYAQVDASGNLTTPISVGGILQQAQNTLISQQGRGQLNFNDTWNTKNEINAIAGFEISRTINNSFANTAYGYDQSSAINNPNIDYITSFPLNPLGSATIPTNLAFGKTTNNFVSYYSNAAYTYNGRYTLSASGRIDKSNLFGVSTNQKSVPLYSIGLSWDLSREDFYHLDWLNSLKLRTTYGYTGNINTTATAVTTLRQFPGNYNPYPNGNPYDFVANPGNPELRWETDRMINLGVDYALKKQILSGSFEYYFKKGNDLFGNSPLAPSTGFTTFFGNTANISGKGMDIVINSRNLYGRDFSWTTNFLFTHVLDKVTRYNAEISANSFVEFSDASTISPLAGKAVYAIYSYHWAGLTHQTGDPQGFLNGKPSTDYVNILSQTSLSQMVYNGPARPTSFGSFRNNFTYKNLTLSVNITYELNYYFRRSSYTSSGLPWQGNEDYFSRWQKPGDEAVTNVPSFQLPPYTADRDLFYEYSSTLIDKGDNIRLKDLRLSYDLDRSKIKGLPFAHLAFYSYIDNIGIIWRANKDHLDPDLVVGSSLSSYPLPRTWAVGVKTNF